MDSKPLLSRFLWYLNMVKTVFNDVRSKMHVCEMGVASIVAACPKTITSLVEFNSAHGNPALNHRNWSASYRLLSTCKWGLEELSWVLLDSALEFIGADEPVMLAVDDTLLRKTGRRIRGCAYARDPLSPPFQANLAWGQRILCVSVLVRSSATSAYRAVPVFFLHVPSVRIPANATQEEMEKLVEMQKKSRMSAVARRLLEAIRKHLDESWSSAPTQASRTARSCTAGFMTRPWSDGAGTTSGSSVPWAKRREPASGCTASGSRRRTTCTRTGAWPRTSLNAASCTSVQASHTSPWRMSDGRPPC